MTANENNLRSYGNPLSRDNNNCTIANIVKVLAWVRIVVGIVAGISIMGEGHGESYGFIVLISSVIIGVFMLGFAIIIQAAYKYLNS